MKLKKVEAHVVFKYKDEPPFIFNMNRLNPTLKQLEEFKNLFDKLFIDEILKLAEGTDH